MTTRHTRPAPLLARLAIGGVLALGLAGGIASGASAAMAPSEDGRAVVPPGSVIPTTPTTLDQPPVRVLTPDLHLPCDDRSHVIDEGGCPPPRPCVGPRTAVVPKGCPPIPCRQLPAAEVPDRCRPNPCDQLRHDQPEWCRHDPCSFEGEGQPAGAGRRRSDPRDCPPPRRCDDTVRCDRPVPGKPNFTG